MDLVSSLGCFASFTQLSVEEEAGPFPLSYWARRATSLLSAALQTPRKKSSWLQWYWSLGTAPLQPNSHPSAGAGSGWWVVGGDGVCSSYRLGSRVTCQFPAGLLTLGFCLPVQSHIGILTIHYLSAWTQDGQMLIFRS